jgi:antitoxin (DNA-binding transcriptional repressor) of toxin-antitoxin stability system
MYSDEQPVYTVNVSELGRNPSRVMSWVGEGSRVFVMRYGVTIAVITPIDQGIDLLLAGSEAFAELRREALEDLRRDRTIPMPER